MTPNFPRLLWDHTAAERQQWAHWIVGSHSDQFLPEMLEAVEQLDRGDPIVSGQPIINPGSAANDLIVIACQRGRHCVVVDQPLTARVVLFDWTGEGLEPDSNPHGFESLSVATECKGQLMEESVCRLGLPQENGFVGFLDDDVLINTSSINTLLAVARIHNLSAAQPAVRFGSSLSLEYGWLRQRSGSTLHRVPLVEIMAPFIRSDLLALAFPFFRGIRSGYGFDRFALPLCAHHLGIWRFAAVDCSPLTHVRSFSSLQKRFSNGLLSKEEELLVRQRLMVAMGSEFDSETYARLERCVSS